MSAPTRSLVIPMFEEIARIGQTLDALRGWASLDATEIVLVDDGSTDGTADLVESRLGELGTTAQLLRLPENRGKGAAVRAGMLAASAPIVGFADADLSAGLDEIDRCFGDLLASGADVVFASRASHASDITVRQPRLRQLSGKFFNVALRVSGLTTFADTQCGLKVFRRDVVEPLFGPLETEGFAFDVEVLLRAQRQGLKLREVPIQWQHFEASRVDPLVDGVAMLRDAFRIRRRLGRRPDPVMVESMADSTFDAMASLEAEHWWFRSKRRAVSAAVERHWVDETRGPAIDVGCGTGETLRTLRDMGFDPVLGTDLSGYALDHARHAAETSQLIACRAEQLPLPGGSVALLSSLDVVEHLDDDVVALREYGRLAAGGLIVVTVPAYQWAWSEHDVKLGHRRRYHRRQLVGAAEAAGLDVLECRFIFQWLVVPALLMRRTPLRHFVRAEADSVSFVNPTVNRMLWWVARAEQALGRVVNVPFGLSLLMVARPAAA